MATYTSKYNLKKPAQDDFYNVDDFNGNFDKLDEHTHSASDVGALSNTGGTLNGDLNISSGNLHLSSRGYINSGENNLFLNQQDDAQNANGLVIAKPSFASLKTSIKLAATRGGQTSYYQLYGEHNKPTTSDVGITAQTSDVTVGSALETGKIILVYEV